MYKFWWIGNHKNCPVPDISQERDVTPSGFYILKLDHFQERLLPEGLRLMEINILTSNTTKSSYFNFSQSSHGSSLPSLSFS